jgi:Ca2+-binding EF-hand superfamily protein
MERLRENFDVYDLVEMLNLSVNDLIDAFDYLIEENEEILDRIAG